MLADDWPCTQPGKGQVSQKAFGITKSPSSFVTEHLSQNFHNGQEPFCGAELPQKSSTMARSLSIGQTEFPQKLPKCPFQPQHGASLPKGKADNRALVPCWGKGTRYGTNRPNYTKRDKSREPPDDLIGSSSGTFPAVLYVSNRGMHALLPRPGDRVNHPKDRGEPRGRRHCWGSPNPAWGEQQPSPCMHCVQSSSAPSLCGLEWVACVVLQSPAHLSKGC